MDWQTLVNWGGGLAVTFASFLAQRAVGKHDKLASDFIDFRLQVANEYVKHTELADIKAMLRRIEDKLDTKADR